MKIEIQEQLFLTKEEMQILEKAKELVFEIFSNSVDDGEIEELTSYAEESLTRLIDKCLIE